MIARLRLLIGAVFLILPSLLFAKTLQLKSVTIPTDHSYFFIVNQKDKPDNWFLVQFHSEIDEAKKALLLEKGFVVSDYIPDSGFMVKLPEGFSIQDLGNISGAKWVGYYELLWRIDPVLLEKISKRHAGRVRVNVEFFEGGNAELNLLIQKKRALFLGKRVATLDLEGQELLALLHAGGVKWVEEYHPPVLQFFNPLGSKASRSLGSETEKVPVATGYESGTKLLSLDSLYAEGFEGEGEIIGISDTGLDSGNQNKMHGDFNGALFKVVPFGPINGDWADMIGHGTHVAGLALGRGLLSNGLISGAARKAKLYMQDIYNDFGMLNVPPDIAELLTPAYQEGVRIHSNSWGTLIGGGGYDQFSASLDRAVWEHPDMVVIFAAGNSGEDLNQDGIIDMKSVYSPSLAKNCISVGASENYLLSGGIQRTHKELNSGKEKWGNEPIASDKLSNNASGIAAFSSRGPTADGRIKPDIVAPGTNIVGPRSSYPDAQTLWGIYNDHYIYAGGTSMATPLVAGSVAVISEFYKKARGVSSPSGALVKATLLNGALDLYPGQYGEGNTQEISRRRPNAVEGWGRVDVAAATQVAYSDKLWFADERPGLKTGDFREYELRVESQEEPLKISLAYTDFPASIAAAKALVNDLDLIVYDPAGHIYHPNGLLEADRINNIETVDIRRPLPGVYLVRVRAENVPQGEKQPFALVATGQIKREGF